MLAEYYSAVFHAMGPPPPADRPRALALVSTPREAPPPRPPAPARRRSRAEPLLIARADPRVLRALVAGA